MPETTVSKLELKVGAVINPDVQKDKDGTAIGKIHRIIWVGTGGAVECQFDGPDGKSLLISLPEGTETKTTRGERFLVTKLGLELASEMEKPFHPPEIHPGTGLPNATERAERTTERERERRDVVDTGKTRADSDAAERKVAAEKKAAAERTMTVAEKMAVRAEDRADARAEAKAEDAKEVRDAVKAQRER